MGREFQRALAAWDRKCRAAKGRRLEITGCSSWPSRRLPRPAPQDVAGRRASVLEKRANQRAGNRGGGNRRRNARLWALPTVSLLVIIPCGCRLTGYTIR